MSAQCLSSPSGRTNVAGGFSPWLRAPINPPAPEGRTNVARGVQRLTRANHLPHRVTQITSALLVALVAGCAGGPIRPDIVAFPPPPAAPRILHLKSFTQLHDLVPPPPSLLTALRGAGLGPWVQQPAGIACAAGHLYICDADLQLVHDWDLATGTARELGTDGVLLEPVAVAVDEAGRVYVADAGEGAVLELVPGRPARRFRPPQAAAYRPTAVVARADTLFVADVIAHHVDRFSIADGTHLGHIGEPGRGPGQLYYPMGLTALPDGRLLVSDSFNARVQVFDTDGKAVASFGQPGDRYGDLGKPRQLAVGPDECVFIPDVEFAHVHVFDTQGRLLLLFGGPQEAPGGTPLPVSTAVAPDLPATLAAMVPPGFHAAYYVFVSNMLGRGRIGLFAVGQTESAPRP